MSLAALQKRLDAHVKSYNDLQKDYSVMITNCQTLDSQLKESEWVQKEFQLIDDETNIYKLIGPVLVKQDQADAKVNVNKRLEFIQNEIKRSEAQIKDMAAKLDMSKAELMKIQNEIATSQNN